MMKELKAIIVGAGPAGLTLGCLLAQAGIKTLLLDHQKQSSTRVRTDNRTAALLRPAVDILQAVGIDPEKLDGTAPLQHLRLIDVPVGDRDDLCPIDFAATEIGERYFALNIKNAALHQALLARAEKLPHLTIKTPVKINQIKQQAGGATLVTDQGNFSAPVIIAADGKNSALRTLAGIETSMTDYHQTALTCTVTHTKAHHNTSIELHRPGGPLTFVPLQGNQSSVVWMEKADTANAIKSLSAKEIEHRLNRDSKGVLGPLKITTEIQSWPITLLCARSLTAPRLALVAEAAHAMPPSGAQGLNLSLRDVEALAHILIAADQTGLDLGSKSVLDQYARARKADIATRLFAVDGLNRLIMTDDITLRHLRRRALRVTSTIRPVRRALMRFGWTGG